MDKYLYEYAEEFKRLKEKFLEMKLESFDASLLAAKFLDAPQTFPKSLYYQIKQKDSLQPYRLVGTELCIQSIAASGRIENQLKMVISIKRGTGRPEIKLGRNQALYFLTLLVLKFKDFEGDATGGFSPESMDLCSHELSNRLDIPSRIFADDDLENLRRKLNENNLEFGAAIESRNTYKRISVPPNHITFSEEARRIFEDLTHGSLEQFEKRYLKAFTE